MLVKISLVTCVLAATTAVHACAQEPATKAGAQPGAQPEATQSQPSGTQAGKSAARSTESPAQPGNAQNRATDAPNPSDANQNRNRRGEVRTGEDRPRNQRDANARRSETTETRYSSSGDKPLDAPLASCLLLGNQKEVAISQFGAERAKSDKVKEFARQMVKDHSQAITMLQRFAGPNASQELGSSIGSTRTNRSETTVNRSTTSTDSNRSSPDGERRDSNTDAKNRDSNNANRNSPDANNAQRKSDVDSSAKSVESATKSNADSERRVANERRADGTERRTANAAGQNDTVRDRSVATVEVRNEHEAIPDKMMAIEREVAQKCIAMAKQELEQSSNFDQAFVGLQISAHVGMIAKLETYKSYASDDLGKVIQESLDTAQGHLRHAKELVTEIGHGASENRGDATNRGEAGARRDSGARREKDSSKDSSKD